MMELNPLPGLSGSTSLAGNEARMCEWSKPSISCLDEVGSSSIWQSEWQIEPLPRLANMNPKNGLQPLSFCLHIHKKSLL